MKNTDEDSSIKKMIAAHDAANLRAIATAESDGRINAQAREYLETLYTDGEGWFREIFHVLGKCFGAPKAAVMPYDYKTGQTIETPMKISDINPLSPYMVYHRLDADPMRNQFFTITDTNRINLSVSSIVSVIVGAQKNIERALEKITGKYYKDYVTEVATTAEQIITSAKNAASGRAIADKIYEKFSERYISVASETVLGIIGRGYDKIAVDLVRALDKIEKPYLRLKDVWRVKCLFDLIPQARTFIERIQELEPSRIISVRDNFYNSNHPRNYRDSKIILDIGRDGVVVPLEIICQVRTFFDYENDTHAEYEIARKSASGMSDDIEKNLAIFREGGIRKYNNMICGCVDDLFERVGWNILYSQKRGDEESLFDGFPKIYRQYFPTKVVDAILDKLDNAVENEVFHVPNAPLKLSQAEERDIFRWMAKFILVCVMPYKNGDWTTDACGGMPGKLFNFVMQELQRYYKK